MKKNLPILILLFFSISIMSAQKKVSKQKLQTFSKIYKQVLDNSFDISSSMKKHVKQLNIPEGRMETILQSYFTGEKVKLSTIEVKQLEQLKALMEIDKAVHDKKINKMIMNTKMDLVEYKSIEKKYHKNVKLQNEVNQLSTKK